VGAWLAMHGRSQVSCQPIGTARRRRRNMPEKVSGAMERRPGPGGTPRSEPILNAPAGVV